MNRKEATKEIREYHYIASTVYLDYIKGKGDIDSICRRRGVDRKNAEWILGLGKTILEGGDPFLYARCNK
jgi:hypothetical protein